MKKIYEHLSGKPVKDFDAAVTYATNNLQQAADNALIYFISPSQGTFERCRADKDFWQRFVSDWVADNELRDAVLQAIEEGDPNLLDDHYTYLAKLAENPNAIPKNMAQPVKKDKEASALEAANQPPQYLH